MKKTRLPRTIPVLTGLTVALTVTTAVAAADTAAASLPVPTATSLLDSWTDNAGPRLRPLRSTDADGVPDISTDRVPDLLTVEAAKGELAVHEGTGQPGGRGAFAGSVKVATMGLERTWLGQGDLNGDGYNDLVSLSSDGTLSLSVHSGIFAGENTFRPERVIARGWGAASLVTVADFVGRDTRNPTELDGLADILFRHGTTIYAYVNQGPDASGNVRFTNLGAILDNAQAVTSMQLADVTGDDFPDFFMTFTDGSARLLDLFAEQDSTGKSHEKWYVLRPSGVDAADVRILTDINGDDYPDLVTRDKTTGALLACLHNGNWEPASPSTVFDPAHPKVLATGWAGYRIVA
ncbi:FG-GAP repeat domain-containing protein [Amycolatopsis sp. NPDC059021]|uniref:FG-GAP repeat domain-containing protein n=1 Tax=Amycolatopsis sp. NPDC059021 TaxID=3346704 RepID=UPI00366C23B3